MLSLLEESLRGEKRREKLLEDVLSSCQGLQHLAAADGTAALVAPGSFVPKGWGWDRRSHISDGSWGPQLPQQCVLQVLWEGPPRRLQVLHALTQTPTRDISGGSFPIFP